MKIEIDFKDAGNKLSGYKLEWLTASNENIEINLYAGAGMGNPYMDLSIKNKKTGKTKWFIADMRDLVKLFFEKDKLRNEVPAPTAKDT